MIWAMTIFLLGLTLILRLCPDTLVARFLHEQLIEVPLARLARMRRQDVFYLILVAGLFLAASELMAMLGSVDLVLTLAADLAVYFDIVAIGLLVAVGSRIKTAFLANRAPQWPQAWKADSSPRKKSGRRRRSRKPSSNDDDDRAGDNYIAA